jgi:CheY-like chemotaxis protein
LAQRKILVVDDNRDSAQTLAWMLELLGYAAHLAYDGPEALERARSLTPNVVLMDIGLPGMNGYETCERMRQLPGMENALFVAQTGWGDAHHRQLSKNAGFNHHLVKPVEIESLRTILGDSSGG